MRTACDLLSALGRLAGLGVVLALGCTDGGAQPAPEEHGELPEPAQVDQAHAGFMFQPERARVVQPTPERVTDPNAQPHLELVLGNPVPNDPHMAASLCPFDVEWRGFPAVSDDGVLLVDIQNQIPSGADSDQESMDVIWLSAEETWEEGVFSRSGDEPMNPNWTGCAGSIAATRERVDALNQAFAKRVWRPLDSLDVFYSKPGHGYELEFTGNEDRALASLAAGDRPIEIYYRNSSFVARVRGIEVLQTTERPSWRGPADDFCTRAAQITGLAFDRLTGVALVTYNYSTGSCLCDANSRIGRVELSPELLAAIDNRSMAPFEAALEELDEQD